MQLIVDPGVEPCRRNRRPSNGRRRQRYGRLTRFRLLLLVARFLAQQVVGTDQRLPSAFPFARIILLVAVVFTDAQIHFGTFFLRPFVVLLVGSQ